jgi:acetyltransferase-like isoleucine patch superfamily enzyme
MILGLVQRVSDILNTIVLRRARARFEERPRILGGVMVVQNRGTLELARGNTFNCSTRANMAGIYKTCSIDVGPGAHLSIGEGTGFSGCSIVCESSIRIGKHCNFGVNVAIYDTDFHPLDSLERRVDSQEIKRRPITIGDDVFVGANSIVLKGASIGDRSIVGAGSVVSGAIPSDQVWAGNPARHIRDLPPKT